MNKAIKDSLKAIKDSLKAIKDLLELYNDPKNSSKDKEHYAAKIVAILNQTTKGNTSGG